ncbi:hypothetical protein Fmac_019741 [Flemingia macrophylla]|uniref:Uncharacterized protein n=1 Tax=Flemingia macrophylla TaxID=520843 RepID=A0ABD1M8M5_9FABA
MAVQLHTHFHPHPHPDDDDDDDDDFLSELTHHMARFLLPDDDSPIASRSHHLQSPWDSPEGSASASSQEPSSPATTPEELSSKSSLDLLLIQNTKLNERRNSNSDSDSDSKHVLGHEIDHALYSYESLIQEQIRAIEQGKGAPRRTRRPRPPRPGPHQDIRALFLHGPAASRGGTGVFLPRAAGGGATTPSESTNKQGKGCATVLIPARVVQALQLHFDQMAATSSGPKSAGFPPLHDVLVSNRDGMYSLQKRQSKKAPASIQHDTILPQEWTY